MYLAVAGGVFAGVFCAVLFPLDVLDEIWDVIESVSEGFLTYSYSFRTFIPLLNGVMCVYIPILVTTFPEWLSGTEPLPHTSGAVRPSSLCL